MDERLEHLVWSEHLQQMHETGLLTTDLVRQRFDELLTKHGLPPIFANEEQPTMEIDNKAWERKMDSKDGTENELDRGQLLLHTHELESRCLELRRQIATLRGHSDAEVREMVGDEMLSLAGIRRRLGT